MGRIYVVGTADTKGEELLFLAGRLRAFGKSAALVDVGTRVPAIEVDVPAAVVAAHLSAEDASGLASGDRGAAVAAMARAFETFIAAQDDIAGVIGVGGGGGTSIVTAGMRALPLGIPKLMVSTLASGDTAPFVDVSDIIMMPSITDMAGLNRISRVILDQAARAIAAMSESSAAAAEGRPAVGLTMFGVTTPCVTAVAEALRADFDPLVFHATGTGGRAMEKLADSGLVSGLIDATTTEIADLLVGGVLPARQSRLDVVAKRRIPYVGSVGALDMVNFWAPETIPAKFRDRLFHRHNPNVTLMRTTPEECAAIGAWIGQKLARCEGPVRFLIPEKGVSALDIEGGAFLDPEADAELFDAIEANISPNASRRIERLPLHINDPDFAAALVSAWRAII